MEYGRYRSEKVTIHHLVWEIPMEVLDDVRKNVKESIGESINANYFKIRFSFMNDSFNRIRKISQEMRRSIKRIYEM
jgi:hypothetical protein